MINFLRRSSVYIIAIVVVMVGLLLLQIFSSGESDKKKVSNYGLWENYKVENLNIEGTDYKVVVADTPQNREKGLMFVRDRTEEFDGMVFRFQDQETRNFWNKNTFVDLKLYWMLDGEVIGTSDLPSIERSQEIVTVLSSGPADTVVEIIQ